jgi:hypothetical protein
MREDNFRVTVVVDGTDLGVWDKCSGGEVDSDETRYRPGSMGSPISLGGQILVANVVVSRMFDQVRDGAIAHTLLARAGKGAIVVKKQPLDVDGNAQGRAFTYTGKLKKVAPPPHDSESSAVAMFELEMVPAGTVA